jgi:hypothetical protein
LLQNWVFDIVLKLQLGRGNLIIVIVVIVNVFVILGSEKIKPDHPYGQRQTTQSLFISDESCAGTNSANGCLWKNFDCWWGSDNGRQWPPMGEKLPWVIKSKSHQ